MQVTKSNVSAFVGVAVGLLMMCGANSAIAEVGARLVAPPVVSQEKPGSIKPIEPPKAGAGSNTREISVSEGKPAKGKCSAPDGVEKRCRNPTQR